MGRGYKSLKSIFSKLKKHLIEPYNSQATKCRVFKLPKDEVEKQRWINVLPSRKNLLWSHLNSLYVKNIGLKIQK